MGTVLKTPKRPSVPVECCVKRRSMVGEAVQRTIKFDEGCQRKLSIEGGLASGTNAEDVNEESSPEEQEAAKRSSYFGAVVFMHLDCLNTDSENSLRPSPCPLPAERGE